MAGVGTGWSSRSLPTQTSLGLWLYLFESLQALSFQEVFPSEFTSAVTLAWLYGKESKEDQHILQQCLWNVFLHGNLLFVEGDRLEGCSLGNKSRVQLWKQISCKEEHLGAFGALHFKPRESH